MVQSRNWKALQKTGSIVVDGVELTLRKRGTKRIIDDMTSVPLLGDAIEIAVEKFIEAKGKAAAGDILREAVLHAADIGDTTPGRSVRNVLTRLPNVIVDTFVEDTVLASEDERDDYREWVGSLSPTDLLALAVGWVELNLPEFKGPLLQALRGLWADARATVATQAPVGATVETAPVPIEAAETPAAESLAA